MTSSIASSSSSSPSSPASPPAAACVSCRTSPPEAAALRFCLRFPPSRPGSPLNMLWHVRGVRLASVRTERRTSVRRVYPMPSPICCTPFGSGGAGAGGSEGEPVRVRRRSLLVQLTASDESTVRPSDIPRMDRAWRRRTGEGASARAESSAARSLRETPEVELSSSKFRLENRRRLPILDAGPEIPSGSVPNSPEVRSKSSMQSKSSIESTPAAGSSTTVGDLVTSRGFRVSSLGPWSRRRACRCPRIPDRVGGLETSSEGARILQSNANGSSCVRSSSGATRFCSSGES
ncbi:hypothetical protein BD413DRAFT_592098 [Trametes elegans]|nr:hypothetical protein BD413DRAFT_592098 [Trametes elegans]